MKREEDSRTVKFQWGSAPVAAMKSSSETHGVVRLG